MSLSPFEKNRGVQQARLLVSDAPDGSYVLELGHGAFEQVRLAVGDYAEASQVLTVDAQAAVIRVRLQVAGPPTLPAGLEWEVSGRLNAVVMFSRRIKAARDLGTLLDAAVPCTDSNRPGTDTLRFRLTVVAA